MFKPFCIVVIAALFIACGSSPVTTKKKEQDLAKLKFGMEVSELSELNKGTSQLSHGVIVTLVYSFYPANKAGIVTGDIIVSINDNTVFDMAGFKEQLKGLKYTYGQVSLGVSRDNKIQKIKVYLE